MPPRFVRMSALGDKQTLRECLLIAKSGHSNRRLSGTVKVWIPHDYSAADLGDLPDVNFDRKVYERVLVIASHTTSETAVTANGGVRPNRT